MHTQRFYDNDRDYHLGDEYKYDLYAMYQLSYNLLGEVQLNGRYTTGIDGEMRDIERGVGHMMKDPMMPFMSPLYDKDHYGGHKLNLTAGLQWQPFPLHIVNLQVSHPVAQNLHGPQMEEGLTLSLMWYIEWPTGRSRRHGKRAEPDDARGL